MTHEQIIDLLEYLGDIYPNVKLKNAQRTIDTWELMFANEDAATVFMAARLHIECSPFFPTIADVKKQMKRAAVMVEMERQKKLEPPKAPAVQIKMDGSCPLHDYECIMKYGELCDGPVGNKCPFEGLLEV